MDLKEFLIELHKIGLKLKEEETKLPMVGKIDARKIKVKALSAEDLFKDEAGRGYP